MVREDLMGRIADLGNLKRAWERVKSNKGSGGIDGETVEAFGERAWTHLREMQSELLEGRYRPVPVRGVEIPKPNGGKRQLGIPTVKDRIVQQAVAQTIMPRYERVFSDSSYGFRPNRRAHDALRRGSAYVAEGYSTVVDLDLSKFFDRVNHDRLMARLARDIGDGRVLRLVLAFLKAGLMQNGVCWRREEGTPQGGPLSPLLANVVLDELDKELERRGHRFCRYADDCNIYVRSQRAGERVMESITRFITRRLRLKVNEEKSKVAPSRECAYLGYTIGSNGQLRIAPKSKEKMRARLKELTARNRGRSLGKVVGELNRVTRGWIEYFKLASAKRWRSETDAWLRRRLRCYRLKQCKRRSGIVGFLVSRGLKARWAGAIAGSGKGWYRLSNTPQANKAMRLEWFSEIGYIPLTA
ncbi:MAG: group II intron reverse transcriptase/maturase [Kiritimatiellae bacterium]|nr:group II intron reverse transcriptase/maturase [Kiritimatiellia bacterium]